MEEAKSLQSKQGVIAETDEVEKAEDDLMLSSEKDSDGRKVEMVNVSRRCERE